MRTRLPVAVLATLAILLSGCGGGSTPGTTGDARPTVRGTPTPTSKPLALNDEQIRRALVTAEGIGPGFVAHRRFPGYANPGDLPCLDLLRGLGAYGLPARHDQIQVMPKNKDLQFPLVFSAVSTFFAEGDAARAMPQIRASVAKCRTSEVGSLKKGRLRMHIAFSARRVVSKADDQFNLLAHGEESKTGYYDIPARLWLNVTRIGTNIVMTGMFTLTNRDNPADSDKVLRYALVRLAAVVAGKPTKGLHPVGLRGLTESDIRNLVTR